MGRRQRSRAEFEVYFYERLVAVNGCLEWPGARTRDGYGVVTFLGDRIMTHRVAVALACLDLRPGDLVLHNCDNKACCRVAHLRIGTHAENMRDASERSIWRQFSEVTKKDVALVMENPEGLTVAQLSVRCNLSYSTIQRIRRGDIYNYTPRYLKGVRVQRRRDNPYSAENNYGLPVVPEALPDEKTI